MIRQPKMPGVTVHFASGMMIKYKKDEFLNNKANKQRFIHYLSDNLERAGCSVDHAKDDADVLIVMTAVASARHKETTDWDDTDLLVLRLHHAEMDAHEVFLKPEPNKSAQQNKICASGNLNSYLVRMYVITYSSSMQSLVVM